MQIDGFIFAASKPISLDNFLYGLMAQEADVEPMPRGIKSLSSSNVFVYLFEPSECDVFICHTLFSVIMQSGGKDT